MIPRLWSLDYSGISGCPGNLDFHTCPNDSTKCIFVYVDYTCSGEAFYVGIGSLRRVRTRKRNSRHSAIAKIYGHNRKILFTALLPFAAIAREIELIAELHTYIMDPVRSRFACNLTTGGEGTYGKKSESHCRAISQSMLGKKHDPERNRRKSERQKGKKRSEELKAKLRKPKKGGKHSEAARQAKSVRMKNIVRSETHRANLATASVLKWQKWNLNGGSFKNRLPENDNARSAEIFAQSLL